MISSTSRTFVAWQPSHCHASSYRTAARAHSSAGLKSSSGVALLGRRICRLSISRRVQSSYVAQRKRNLGVSAISSVDVETGCQCLRQGTHVFLDVRSEREYDYAHITKPPQVTFNVPIAEGGDFVSKVAAKIRNKSANILVACTDGGAQSQQAVALLNEAGYANANLVEGGWAAWTDVFDTTGRRKPPAGRWVSTGTEALKSGLGVGSAADTYEEGGAKDGIRLQP